MQNLRSGKNPSNKSEVQNSKQKQIKPVCNYAAVCSSLSKQYEKETQDPVLVMPGFTRPWRHWWLWVAFTQLAHKLWGFGVKQTQTCCSTNQNNLKIKEAKEVNLTDEGKLSI